MNSISKAAQCIISSALVWVACSSAGQSQPPIGSTSLAPPGWKDQAARSLKIREGQEPIDFAVEISPREILGQNRLSTSKEQEALLSLTVPPSAALSQPLNIDSYQATDLLGAAPENLNPGLYVPPVAPPPPTSLPESPQTFDPNAPLWQIETLTVDFRDDFNNFARGNRIFEPTVTGRLRNGDRLSFSTGLNTFTQPAIDLVFNVPLRVAWTRRMGDFTTTLGAGVDVFNRLPLALNLAANTSVPIGNSTTLSLNLEQGPYKFNATSLQNQITAWRYGPNLFWQITPDTSLFSQLRLGNLNDGNWEQQSFSQLEHRLGEFTLAANLFNWRFGHDVEATSGYFSPPDFLVTNAELAWRGQVSPDLTCRVAGNLGPQRLVGNWSLTYGYEALCTAKFNQVELDLGYTYSNVTAAGTGGSTYNNRTIRGQVRAKF